MFFQVFFQANVALPSKYETNLLLSKPYIVFQAHSSFQLPTTENGKKAGGNRISVGGHFTDGRQKNPLNVIVCKSCRTPPA